MIAPPIYRLVMQGFVADKPLFLRRDDMVADVEIAAVTAGADLAIIQGFFDRAARFGIVAAVLGIVVTMGMLGDGDKEALGHHVAAALVGTFLGILAAYGFFGPLANVLEHDAKEELNLYESVKACLIGSVSGLPPAMSVEFGRKVLMPGHRPSFKELEESIRNIGKS